MNVFGDISALIIVNSFSSLYKSLYKLYFGIICFSIESLSQYIFITVINSSSSFIYNILIGVYTEESKGIFR